MSLHHQTLHYQTPKAMPNQHNRLINIKLPPLPAKSCHKTYSRSDDISQCIIQLLPQLDFFPHRSHWWPPNSQLLYPDNDNWWNFTDNSSLTILWFEVAFNLDNLMTIWMNTACIKCLETSNIFWRRCKPVIEVAMSTKEKAMERQEAGNLQTVLNTNHSLRDGK